MVYLKKLLLVLMVFLVFKSWSQNDGLEVKFTYTGNFFGRIIKAEIQNTTSQTLGFVVNPFYMPATKSQSGYIITKGVKLQVDANESMVVFFEGYSTHLYKKLNTNKDQEINTDVVFKLSNEFPISYDSIVGKIQTFETYNLSNSELIPYDFIVTHPGSHFPLGYYFKLENSYELANVLIYNQSKLLEKGYDRLYTAGKLVSHFNNDPDLEKAILLQLSTWICVSGLEGIAIKKSDVKRALNLIFDQANSVKEIQKHFKKSYSRYYNIIRTIGRESRTFIIPGDMDKSPQCLPDIVGFKKTSDAVKVPLLRTESYEVYPIRNQKYIAENDCLPCSFNEANNDILECWIISAAVKKLVTQNMKSIRYSEFAKKDLFIDFYDNLNSLNAYNGHEWMRNTELSEIDREKFALEYYDQLINLILFAQKEYQEPDQIYINLLNNSKAIFEELFFLYKNNSIRYSLDCCSYQYAPSQSHRDIASELLVFYNQLKTGNNISNETNADFIQFYLQTASLIALDRMLDVFRAGSTNTQTIFMDLSIDGEDDAKNALKSELNISPVPYGNFAFGQFTIPIDENDQIIFNFSSSNCGEIRESTIPFLKQENYKTKDQYNFNVKPINIIPKKELAISMGTVFMNAKGLQKYNGKGTSVIQTKLIEPAIDSIFKALYTDQYKLGETKDFTFNNVLNFRGDFGYNINNNLQLRLVAQYSKGFIEGYLPITYLENPPNISSETTYDALVRSELNILQLGGGVRYYLGRKIKPFIGLNGYYSNYNNTYVKLYADYIEIELDEFETYSKSSLSTELGLRYVVNQDMFIDLVPSAIYRMDIDAQKNAISAIDYGINFFIGMNF